MGHDPEHSFGGAHLKEIGPLLAAERELERRIAAGAADDAAGEGWTAALMFFHLAQWRGRLLAALCDVAQERSYSAPPHDVDEVNDAELPAAQAVPLADAAVRSDAALGSLIKLWELLGERPFQWYAATTTSEALTRNSILHARIHIASYLAEHGRRKEGDRLVEKTASELRAVDAPPQILGAALYNLAAARAAQGHTGEAIALLEEAAPMRPDLGSYAIDDRAFEALRDDPRFRALVGKGTEGQSR